MDALQSYEAADVAVNDSCLTYEDVSSKKKKFILIQAPSHFDIGRLSGENILLDGQQELAADENSDKGKRYTIKSKMNCKKSLKSFNVLLPSKEDGKMKLARQLYGSINVVQSVFVPPVTFPDKEEVVLPEIPENRKHQWTPFGSDEPMKIEKSSKRKVSPKKFLASESEPEEKRKKSNKEDKSFLEPESQKQSKHNIKQKVKEEYREAISENLIVSPEKNVRRIIDDHQTNFGESPKKKHKNKKSKR